MADNDARDRVALQFAQDRCLPPCTKASAEKFAPTDGVQTPEYLSLNKECSAFAEKHYKANTHTHTHTHTHTQPQGEIVGKQLRFSKTLLVEFIKKNYSQVNAADTHRCFYPRVLCPKSQMTA